MLPAGSGRLIPADNLHITLFFLGEVTAQQRSCAEAVAGALHGSRFTLSLERLGYWRRPQVVWLAAPATPPPLQQLVSQLQQGLAECGFEVESRPYQAHLTLARKVRRPPPVMSPDPVPWPVDRFVLVRSELSNTGSRYEIVGSWPLQ